MNRVAFGMARAVATAASSAVAMNATIHPVLAARLMGMGEHGMIDLQSNAKRGRTRPTGGREARMGG
jgi:hypothetical protein